MEITEIKIQLHTACRMVAEERIERIQTSLKEAQAAANNETKSSSGDKYETTRAMMHLEIENLSGQLAEAQKLLKTLHVIPVESTGVIGLGSIVRTNHGNFFLAVGAGKTTVEGEEYFLLSQSAPIAQAMLHKGIGEHIEINSRTFTILNIQ